MKHVIEHIVDFLLELPAFVPELYLYVSHIPAPSVSLILPCHDNISSSGDVKLPVARRPGEMNLLKRPVPAGDLLFSAPPEGSDFLAGKGMGKVRLGGVINTTGCDGGAGEKKTCRNSTPDMLW
ncbi:MAG TPA: hypothetical protein P5172_04760 [Syntrophales bacterium]|jgi:hypothetical protein|nr:hypothetical protein [Syntrophales bacterium]HRR46720.1 hypothetical protein [Syntrophales bacterium]HRU88251.1 hypothetical protein [Syntrophales bacterium]